MSRRRRKKGPRAPVDSLLLLRVRNNYALGSRVSGIGIVTLLKLLNGYGSLL